MFLYLTLLSIYFVIYYTGCEQNNDKILHQSVLKSYKNLKITKTIVFFLLFILLLSWINWWNLFLFQIVHISKKIKMSNLSNQNGFHGKAAFKQKMLKNFPRQWKNVIFSKEYSLLFF